jgi:hypothetical protein
VAAAGHVLDVGADVVALAPGAVVRHVVEGDIHAKAVVAGEVRAVPVGSAGEDVTAVKARVEAVGRVPRQHVRPGAAVEDVAAEAPIQGVLAQVAVEVVGALATVQGVVAPSGVEFVVAGAAVERLSSRM